MRFTVQRRLAAQILKCSTYRIRFQQDAHETIKESITNADIRALINSGIVKKLPQTGISRGRIRHVKSQKTKGRRKGQGSRKGTTNARSSQKTTWINKTRLQRAFIKELRDKELVTTSDYRMLYQKVKGGFFRNKRHIKLFIEERELIKR